MGSIRVDMTMSLDGYVTGPDDGPDAPMGVGGFRLFNWLDKRGDPGSSGDVYAELMATRALISGRRTYELAGRWGGDHHNGVPIFVLTHDIPDETPPGTSATSPTSPSAPGRPGPRSATGWPRSPAPARPRHSCVPVRSTSCNCTSSRCCSAAADACSTTSRPSTSSSTSSGRCGPATSTTPPSTSCTCATASGPNQHKIVGGRPRRLGE